MLCSLRNRRTKSPTQRCLPASTSSISCGCSYSSPSAGGNPRPPSDRRYTKKKKEKRKKKKKKAVQLWCGGRDRDPVQQGSSESQGTGKTWGNTGPRVIDFGDGALHPKNSCRIPKGSPGVYMIGRLNLWQRTILLMRGWCPVPSI